LSQITHVPAGEGDTLWVVGDTYTLKATAETTDGSLALIEASIPAGSGPPPHVHTSEDEAYYVLEGQIEVLDGERMFLAGPGSFVFIPRGVVHRFRNTGHGHARMLVLFQPAGFEEFLRGVGQPAEAGAPAPPLDDAELARTVQLAPRFGLELRVPEALVA
jgi:quercetin dioxygenase-like cupin family protein